jgi:hypothetical protein
LDEAGCRQEDPKRCCEAKALKGIWGKEARRSVPQQEPAFHSECDGTHPAP